MAEPQTLKPVPPAAFRDGPSRPQGTLKAVPPNTARDGPPRPFATSASSWQKSKESMMMPHLGSTRQQLDHSLSHITARSGDWKIRQNLATDLRKGAAERPTKHSVTVLGQLAQDKDARVRTTATDEMRKLADSLGKTFREAPQSRETFDTLLELAMEDTPPDVRDHANTHLQKLAGCPSTAVRQASTDAFGKALAAGKKVPAASELLPQLTTDKYCFVRERAAVALGKAVAADPVSPGILNALQKVALDPDVRVRRAADDELKRLGGSLATTLSANLFVPGAFETLVELSQHPSWAVRGCAVYGFNDVILAAEGVARRAKEDKDNASQSADEAAALAVTAAQRASDKRAEAEAAANAATNLSAKKGVAPAELEKAQEDAAALGQEAAEAIREQESAEHKAQAEKATAGKSTSELVAAGNVAASAFRAMLSLVSDSSAKVRLSVAKSLRVVVARGSAPPAILEGLRTLVLDNEDDIRLCASTGLAKAAGQSRKGATQILLDLSKEKSWRIRYDVAQALGIDKAGVNSLGPEILSALQKLCKDGFNDVRSAAASALKGMKIMALFEEEWRLGVIKKVVEEDHQPANPGSPGKRWLVQLDAETKGSPRYTKSIKAIQS